MAKIKSESLSSEAMSKLSVLSKVDAWFRDRSSNLKSKKESRYPLKIVDSSVCKKTNEKIFVIQYVGRALIQKYTLSVLLSDPKVLGALYPKRLKIRYNW